jgi:preprotein translocase subunit SecY
MLRAPTSCARGFLARARSVELDRPIPCLDDRSAMSRTTHRILVTLALLVAYRFGFTVPIPGLSVEFPVRREEQEGLFGLLSAFTGGAVGQTTITSLGLLPYLSVALFFWLLIQSTPRMRERLVSDLMLQKCIERWKRNTTVLVAIVLGLFLCADVFLRQPSMIDESLRGHDLLLSTIVVLSLAAGATFVQWLAELITRYGAGHGALVIVTAGLLARVLHTVNQLPSESFWSTIMWMSALWFAAVMFITYLNVYLAKHLRR